MNWTVKELKERLEDYGDHLSVAVVINEGENDREVVDSDISDGHSPTLDELVVRIEVET